MGVTILSPIAVLAVRWNGESADTSQKTAPARQGAGDTCWGQRKVGVASRVSNIPNDRALAMLARQVYRAKLKHLANPQQVHGRDVCRMWRRQCGKVMVNVGREGEDGWWLV